MSSSSPPPPNEYGIILDAYGKLISHTPPSLSIKVLRAMLDFAPSESGKINIAHEILSSQDISRLGDYYMNTMILPLRASSGKTPPRSRPSGIDSVDGIATTLGPSSRNFQRTLKQQLLLRDNNRCIITGTFDRGKYALLPDTERNSLALNRVLTDDTQACHIVPFVIADFDDSGVSSASSRFLLYYCYSLILVYQVCSAAAIWDAIIRMSPEVSREGDGNFNFINDHSNAITLTADLHRSFGRFDFIMESTVSLASLLFAPTPPPTCNIRQGIPHQYHLKHFNTISTRQLRDFPTTMMVHLQSHDNRWPLPSPRLLALHAAIGNIWHASGMADYVEKILREVDSVRCFSKDGSTDVQFLQVLMAFRPVGE